MNLSSTEYQKSDEFKSLTLGEQKDFFYNKKQALKEIDKQGGLKYTKRSITTTERGTREDTTVTDNKGNIIDSYSTGTTRTIDGKQPSLNDIAPNVQRNNNKQVTAVFNANDKRFISNIQQTGTFDLERQQSISNIEKEKRLRTAQTSIKNPNMRFVINDKITKKDGKRLSVRVQDKANSFYDQSKTNFSKGTFGKNSSFPIINEINSLKGISNRSKSIGLTGLSAIVGTSELLGGIAGGGYNYFKSGNYLNFPKQASNVIKKTPAFIVAGTFAVGKFGFNTNKYFSNKEYRQGTNKKGFDFLKGTQLYKRPDLALTKFGTEIFLFDKGFKLVSKANPFKSSLIQKKELLVPSNKKTLGFNTKNPKGEVKLKGVSYVSGSTSATSISSNLPQKSGFVLGFKEKLKGLNNAFKTVNTKIIVNNGKITKLQSLGKIKLKTTQTTGDKFAKVFKLEKGKYKLQGKTPALNSGESNFLDILGVTKPTKTKLYNNVLLQQAETKKVYDITQAFNINKNLVGKITAKTKTISGTAIKRKGVSRKLNSVFNDDGLTFSGLSKPKTLKNNLGIGKDLNIDDLFKSFNKKPIIKLEAVGRTVEKATITPLKAIKQADLYTSFNSKTVYKGSLNLKSIPINKKGSVSSIFGVNSPVSVIDPIFKINVPVLKPLSSSFDSNLINLVKPTTATAQTNTLKSSVAFASLKQKQQTRQDVFLKNNVVALNLNRTSQKPKYTFDTQYKTAQAQAQATTTKTRTKTKLGLVQLPALKLALLPELIPPISTNRFIPVPVTIPKTPIPPKTPFLPLIFPTSNKKRSFPLPVFDIFVKSKGKYKNVGTKTSSFDAFNLGASIVNKTASASFKISQRGQNKGLSNNFINFGFNSMFRRSKKEDGVFIEKRKFRLNTKGEKNQITYKGTRTNFLRGLLK